MASSTAVLSEVVVNNGLYKRPAGNFTGAAKTYTGERIKICESYECITGISSRRSFRPH
jgi:phosphotransferase system HPr-like phosphotransfer protein